MTDDRGVGSFLSSVFPRSVSPSTDTPHLGAISGYLSYSQRSSSFVSCEIFSLLNSDKRRRGLTEADCHVTVFHTRMQRRG